MWALEWLGVDSVSVWDWELAEVLAQVSVMALASSSVLLLAS